MVLCSKCKYYSKTRPRKVNGGGYSPTKAICKKNPEVKYTHLEKVTIHANTAKKNKDNNCPDFTGRSILSGFFSE